MRYWCGYRSRVKCRLFAYGPADATAIPKPYRLLPHSNLDWFYLSVPSVLWHCWLGGRKGIRPVKIWVVGCWRGYLSRARCRLAYDPADATAIPKLYLLPHLNPDWLYLSGTGLPRLSWKRGRWTGVEVVAVSTETNRSTPNYQHADWCYACDVGLRECAKMKMKVAEDAFEVHGSSVRPGTFAPRKARLNRLQQVSVCVCVCVCVCVSVLSCTYYAAAYAFLSWQRPTVNVVSCGFRWTIIFEITVSLPVTGHILHMIILQNYWVMVRHY